MTPSAPKAATARLIQALRMHSWPPDEAKALDRRHATAELRKRHRAAAVAAWRHDMPACRWHIERMTAFKAPRHA